MLAEQPSLFPPLYIGIVRAAEGTSDLPRALSRYIEYQQRIDIVRAVGTGEPFTTLPFVRPGGDILLKIEGWPKVSQVLAAIDAVEAAGVDPCDAAADHWRHVHNRIAAGQQPRLYTIERHRAWLKRREIEG